jgi:ketol-acid reductoisomerase
MEMYMSEEMETVWRAFREKGFFASSHDHGPTAMFGGYMRSMEFLSSGLNDTFAHILEEIRSGAFARKFEDERRNGYPQLTLAKDMTETDSPMTAAETHLRQTMIGALNG